MRSARLAVAAMTRRRHVCPASSAARRRCRRIGHCVATFTSWMPAPAFSRDRTVVPSIRRRQRALAHAQPFPSSRHDYHSSTEAGIRQVHPPTGSNRAHPPAAAKRRSAALRRRWRRGGSRRATGGTGPARRRGARESVAARAALDLCNTAARSPAERSSGGHTHLCNRYATSRPGRDSHARAGTYIRSIIALPNPEQLTCVEPGISRAKS
jgi:hypothetical protein